MIVVVLSALVIPGPAANHGTVVSLSVAVPVYVVAAVLVGAVWGTTGALGALRWSTRGQEPTEEEQVRTLAVPWFLTRVQAYLWLGATVLFTVLAVAVQPGVP